MTPTFGRVYFFYFFLVPVSDLLNRVIMNPGSDDHNSILYILPKYLHRINLLVSDTLGPTRISPAFGNPKMYLLYDGSMINFLITTNKISDNISINTEDIFLASPLLSFLIFIFYIEFSLFA